MAEENRDRNAPGAQFDSLPIDELLASVPREPARFIPGDTPALVERDPSMEPRWAGTIAPSVTPRADVTGRGDVTGSRRGQWLAAAALVTMAAGGLLAAGVAGTSEPPPLTTMPPAAPELAATEPPVTERSATPRAATPPVAKASRAKRPHVKPRPTTPDPTDAQILAAAKEYAVRGSGWSDAKLLDAVIVEANEKYAVVTGRLYVWMLRRPKPVDRPCRVVLLMHGFGEPGHSTVSFDGRDVIHP